MNATLGMLILGTCSLLLPACTPNTPVAADMKHATDLQRSADMPSTDMPVTSCTLQDGKLAYSAPCQSGSDCDSGLCEDTHGGGDDFRCTQACTNMTGIDQDDPSCPGLDGSPVGTCRAAGYCKVFAQICD